MEIINGVVMSMVWAGFAVYFAGLIWSGVLAYRLKKYGYLISLLFIGPLSYPFFAIAYRKQVETNFRVFLVGISMIVLGLGLMYAMRQVS